LATIVEFGGCSGFPHAFGSEIKHRNCNTHAVLSVGALISIQHFRFFTCHVSGWETLYMKLNELKHIPELTDYVTAL
jgi:hypothetical protein